METKTFISMRLSRNGSMLLVLLGFVLLPLISTGKDSPKPCGESTELECRQSAECTLVQSGVHGKYTCRASVGRCETGFRQSADHDIQKDCESKPGCQFKAADCYCPPGLQCTCGGGPPAQCMERRNSR